jgi:membrane fusion protein, heavy metal efflux system
MGRRWQERAAETMASIRGLAFVAILVALGCERSSATSLPPPPPGEVWLASGQVERARIEVMPAREETVGNEVTTTGRLSFVEQRVQRVFSPVTGRIVKITAEVGQRVKKNDPLAILESPDLGVTAADVGKAAADFAAAAHNYQRQKELAVAHAVAQKDYEQAEGDFRRARAELERAREKAKLLRGSGPPATPGSYVLRALIDGEVVARNLNPGLEVQGQYSGGTAVELFTIGELDPLWVFADVFEMDLARVKSGAGVTITAVSYPGEEFRGSVDWISNVIDPTTRVATARATFPNPDRRLKPGMFVTVRVQAEGQRRLAVPRKAVLRLGETQVVYVRLGRSPDGRWRFAQRPVVANDRGSGPFVSIEHGLARGEEVVVSGAIFLSRAGS